MHGPLTFMSAQDRIDTKQSHTSRQNTIAEHHNGGVRSILCLVFKIKRLGEKTHQNSQNCIQVFT